VRVSEGEIDLILERCRSLSGAKGNYLEADFIRNLFLTVLDFQMHGRSVEKAIQFYTDHAWDKIRSIDELQALLSMYPDDKDGNTEVAQVLWGNKHWTRIGLLRRLVEFFKELRIENQERLRDWATTSDYNRDFKGRIPGMGLAIYNWLVMRQGVEKVKPDVHLHRFVKNTIGRTFSDADLADTLQEVARRMSLKAYELDWRIWEHQRGQGWTVPPAASTTSIEAQ